MIKSKLLEKAKKQFDELNKLKVEVGVLENTRPYKKTYVSVVEVATIHEFGTEKIPPHALFCECQFVITKKKLSEKR